MMRESKFLRCSFALIVFGAWFGVVHDSGAPAWLALAVGAGLGWVMWAIIKIGWRFDQ